VETLSGTIDCPRQTHAARRRLRVAAVAVVVVVVVGETGALDLMIRFYPTDGICRWLNDRHRLHDRPGPIYILQESDRRTFHLRANVEVNTYATREYLHYIYIYISYDCRPSTIWRDTEIGFSPDLIISISFLNARAVCGYPSRQPPHTQCHTGSKSNDMI